MKTGVSLLRTLIPNLLVALFGLLLALGLVEIVLRLNPNWVPLDVRVTPPVRRSYPLTEGTVEVRLSSGDLFFWEAGRIRPIPPAVDQLLAMVHYQIDENGFLNAPPQKPVYDHIALGDSYTGALFVPDPWPQKLDQHLGTDTLNLGLSGFGPQEALWVLEDYGLARRPKWVILAYFEGNDLSDAANYERVQPFIVLRLGKYFFDQGRIWLRSRPAPPDEAAAEPSDPTEPAHPYPVTLDLNGNRLEMAFFSRYISWLSLSRTDILDSRNYFYTTRTLSEMKAASAAAGARLLVVYLPSKPHVYLPFLFGTEDLERILDGVEGVFLDREGFLQFSGRPLALDDLMAHRDDQAAVLAAFARENGIDFIDLTPHFQAAAAEGTGLYYPYDTHWNQNGHDLAARIVADYLAAQADPGED